jgi:hypothetical protein
MGIASNSPGPRSFMFHYRILRLLFSEVEPRFVHKLYTKSGAVWRPKRFVTFRRQTVHNLCGAIILQKYCVYLSIGS